MSAASPAAFAGFIAGRPEFEHVCTGHRSPGTNSVIGRFNGSTKYEGTGRSRRYTALLGHARPPVRHHARGAQGAMSDR
jgi:hypothetical protein